MKSIITGAIALTACNAFVTAALAALTIIPKPQELRETGGSCYETNNVKVVRDASLAAEGYRLKVTPAGVEITAADAAGELYARETLKQLDDGQGGYSCAEISDSPRFGWRGLLLDEARHFFGKDTVKGFLDLMAKHKLNVFHWHLVDDQGWRIELKRHPELTRYGAVRPCSPKYGAYPTWPEPDRKLRYELNDEQYGPYFYTREDLREIVDYAKARGIRVVPEIELPGHERALLAAHPECSCTGESLPRVPRVYWSIEDDVLCAGNDATIKLMEDIFDEVTEIFHDSPVIHIGGDECPKTRWEKCPKCQARIKALGLKDEKALQAWMVTHFTRYLEQKGRRSIGWDEVLEGDIPASTIAMSWRQNRKDRYVMTAGEAAKRGHDVVNTQTKFCYLDYCQGLKDDPYHYYFGSKHCILPVKKCYEFDPCEGVAPEDRHHILGGQGNCWAEFTFNRIDLEWLTWTRAAALAEVLWTGTEKRDWNDFARRLDVHRRRLIAEHVNMAPFDGAPKPTETAKIRPFEDGERVMFLGDSITHGGMYVANLQYFWSLRYPDRKVTFLNGGICGHTAPDGVKRFDWDIAPQKPDRVFIMFGMNDVFRGGSWDGATCDAAGFARRTQAVDRYRESMRELVAKCRGIGAEVALISSTPYDEYSTLIAKKASKGVNDPGLWTLSQVARELALEEGIGFIDLYAPLTPILRDNPEVKFLTDRVHPHNDGHLLMAAIILEACGFSSSVGGAVFDGSKGAVRFTYSPKALPIPFDDDFRSGDRMYPLTEKLNREIVRITGLRDGAYRLKAAGKEIGVHSAAQLAKGVNIANADTPSQKLAKDGAKLKGEYKKLGGSLRGIPQAYFIAECHGADVNSEESIRKTIADWLEDLRIKNAENGHYFRYYTGEMNRFWELYPKREAEAKRLDEIRGQIFEHVKKVAPFEIEIEPVVSQEKVPDLTSLPRAELKKLFEENVFGVRPVEKPPVEEFVQLSPDEEVFDGLGIRRPMKMVFGDGKGRTAEVRFTAYLPKKEGRHPAFLLIAPHDPDTIYRHVGPGRPDRMPVKELLKRGYAGISYKNNDSALDYGEGNSYACGIAMTNGVWKVFGGREARTRTSWGAISAWAWGASRVMDWIETVPELDAKRVAVVGLSRCGKTALWAGASDERFALTISCCSGCGGAKLNRVDLPRSEHIADLHRNFPHWFANSYYEWEKKDTEAPFDMHGLVALCAPRCVIVTSASEDAWAGQFGEFESCRLASKAWTAAGKTGLVAPHGFPAEQSPLYEGSVGYHIRTGRHDQLIYDWKNYMDFFDRHLGKAQ